MYDGAIGPCEQPLLRTRAASLFSNAASSACLLVDTPLSCQPLVPLPPLPRSCAKAGSDRD